LKIPGEDRLPSRGVTPADRSTDFRYGLKPLKARPKPAASSRTNAWSLYFQMERTGTACGDADNGAGSDRRKSAGALATSPSAASVDTQRQEGQGVPRGAPAIGREKPLKGEPQECRRYETRPAG